MKVEFSKRELAALKVGFEFFINDRENQRGLDWEFCLRLKMKMTDLLQKQKDFDTTRNNLAIWLNSYGGGAPEPTQEDIDEFKLLADDLVQSLEDNDD